jgi:hypothetical protein
VLVSLTVIFAKYKTYTRFCVLTGTLKFQLSWEITPCRLGMLTYISEDLDASIFRIIQEILWSVPRVEARRCSETIVAI